MATLPKRNNNLPVTARKKAVPGIKPKEPPVPSVVENTLPKDKILELINRRQRQVIVHSVIYYRMNNNLISDSTFDTWARELVKLQKDYPELAEQSAFYEDLKDFDATTGFHLANHQWGIGVAERLLAVKRGDTI